jgi:hypothetical protein
VFFDRATIASIVGAIRAHPVILSEVSNANEVEGSRTASRSEAVPALRVGVPGGFYLFIELLTQDA